MKWLKLTLLPSLLFNFLLLNSCKKDDEIKSRKVFIKTNLPMSSAQEIPNNGSTATGTIDATYRKDTKTLSYTVNWSGLTGPVAAMHIHGVADPGVSAGVLQNIITSSNGIDKPGPKYDVSGTISANVFMDETVFKESDLLANKYYINIHTADNPGGEIRGQLTIR